MPFSFKRLNWNNTRIRWIRWGHIPFISMMYILHIVCMHFQYFKVILTFQWQLLVFPGPFISVSEQQSVHVISHFPLERSLAFCIALHLDPCFTDCILLCCDVTFLHLSFIASHFHCILLWFSVFIVIGSVHRSLYHPHHSLSLSALWALGSFLLAIWWTFGILLLLVQVWDRVCLGLGFLTPQVCFLVSTHLEQHQADQFWG